MVSHRVEGRPRCADRLQWSLPWVNRRPATHGRRMSASWRSGGFTVSAICRRKRAAASWRFVDHRVDPAGAGGREDPHAPGPEDRSATAGASPWADAASDLTFARASRSGGLASPVEGQLRPRLSGEGRSDMTARVEPPMTAALQQSGQHSPGPS